MCIAGAIGGAAVVGAAGSVFGASKQASAAENAQNIAEQQQQQNAAYEAPYRGAGNLAVNQLDQLEGLGIDNGTGGFGSLNQAFNASDFQELSPAYGFQLQQGLQGESNADSSSLGAESGAAQKDLIGYGQSLANTSFNNAFNQYQQQNTNIYNRLANIANLGQSAASGTAQTGTTLAGTAASAATNAGNAYANGATGVANAATGYAQNNLLSGFLNNTPTNASANYAGNYSALDPNYFSTANIQPTITNGFNQ